MGPSEGYFYGAIAMGVAFIASLFVFFNVKRKWVGCILQIITFILTLLSCAFFFSSVSLL